MKNAYTLSSVTDFINNTLVPQGYEICMLQDGALLDDMIAVAPDENHYNYVFRAVTLNEWNSAYTVRRTAKISKALQDEMNAYCESH